MRHANNKKKDKVGPAIILCFCLIALTSLFTVKSSIDKINESAQTPVSGETSVDVTEKNDSSDSSNQEKENNEAVHKDKISNDVSAEDSSKDSNEESAEVSAPVIIDSLKNSTPTYVYPLSSSDAFVINPFSMNSLIYSATLDQYMTHCGTDIQAPEGTPVLSIGDGIVTDIYSDDRFGHTIKVTHTDNLLVVYSNLGDGRMVEIGDSVTAGTPLAQVGTSALFESLDPPHLHIEILKNGLYVNPEDYINNNL